MNKKIFENVILAAIILVIIQTFLDEYSRYINLSVSIRNLLLFTGLLFDLIFSIEFVLRSIWAAKKKQLKLYLFYRRGWIDFCASLPLLLLNSGPMVWLFIKGDLAQAGSAIAVLNILKVVKAIRVTRILRLMRLLKIFGKIHNAESKMAQRHTQTISTTGVFTIVMLLITLSFFKFNKFEALEKNRKENYIRTIESIDEVNKTYAVPVKELYSKMLSKDKNLLKFYHDKKLLYFSNIPDKEFKKYYDYENYVEIKKLGYKLYVSLVDIKKLEAGVSLQNFIIIVGLILSFMLIYTRHFVQTISDIIHIIKRGFKEKDYNLQVKINEPFKEDEIFQLAEEYNENYLPLKSKIRQEEKAKKATVLSMDDLMNFGKKEEE